MRVVIQADGAFRRRGDNLEGLRAVWPAGEVRESERFALAEYFFIAVTIYASKPFWAKFVEKVAEEIGGEVGKDLAAVYRSASDTIKWAFKAGGTELVRLIWQLFDADPGVPGLSATCDSTDPAEHARALDALPTAVAVYHDVVAVCDTAGLHLKELHFRWEGGSWRWVYALSIEDISVGEAELQVLRGKP